MSREAAIELLIYKPNLEQPVPAEQRGVVANHHLAKRFNQLLTLGVYLETSENIPEHESKLRYYFFEQCDNQPKIYHSLNELRSDLPDEFKNFFENDPKLYIMGHGNGGFYGLGNCHGPSEHIYGEDFDRLLLDFKNTLPSEHQDIFVTLEACNTDSLIDATAENQEKTFLQRASMAHPDITFGGTGPWHPEDPQTGFRSLATEAPITSMAGNVWKSGNSVAFYHDTQPMIVKKALSSTTETAKQLKINTFNYARDLLGENMDESLAEQIACHRDILRITDLQLIDSIAELQVNNDKLANFLEVEAQLLTQEQEHYLQKVRDILNRANPLDDLSDRDILELTLGLKEPNIFAGNDDVFASIFQNRELLQLLMVSCGKVLIGGPSNATIINRLSENNIDINSVDTKGNSALHYAVQNFYNYRKEPLALIHTLLAEGADLDLANHQGLTPIDLAQTHSEDPRVRDSDMLLFFLQINHSSLSSSELKQLVKNAVRKVFQMSLHMADELCSLPSERREYVNCKEGTLFMSTDAEEKLGTLLQPLAGNHELLLAFESELKSIILDLKSGKNTGTIVNIDDENQAKIYAHAEEKLYSVFDRLQDVKQEKTEQNLSVPQNLNMNS